WKRPASRLAVSHRLSDLSNPVLDPAVAGPAIAGRRQRDVVLDQSILEHRDAFGVPALLALVLGRRCLGPNLDPTILAILVAQGLAVGRLIAEHADAAHAGLRLADLDHDAAILGLAHPVARRHEQLLLAPSGDGDGGGWHALLDERIPDGVGATQRQRHVVAV